MFTNIKEVTINKEVQFSFRFILGSAVIGGALFLLITKGITGCEKADAQRHTERMYKLEKGLCEPEVFKINSQSADKCPPNTFIRHVAGKDGDLYFLCDCPKESFEGPPAPPAVE